LKEEPIVGNNDVKQPTANGIGYGSEKINKIIEVSKIMNNMEKSEEEKDKTIEQLKRRLKKEKNFAFL